MLFINDFGGQPHNRGLSIHCLALEDHLDILDSRLRRSLINKNIAVYELL
jgi:hypothetical protein